MNNPCLDIKLPKRLTTKFEIGDKFVHTTVDKFATIVDIRDNGILTEIWLRRANGDVTKFPWGLMVDCLDGGRIIHVKNTKLPEELFII